MGSCISLSYCFILFYFIDKCTAVLLLDCMVFIFVIFWGTCILFSTVAAPVSIPTNSARVPFSPHSLQHLFHLVRVCVCVCVAILTEVRLCLVHFIRISLLVSDVVHVCLLWRNVCSCLLPIFLIGIFTYWVLSCISSYIFWMLILYQICHLQTSSFIP